MCNTINLEDLATEYGNAPPCRVSLADLDAAGVDPRRQPARWQMTELEQDIENQQDYKMHGHGCRDPPGTSRTR